MKSSPSSDLRALSHGLSAIGDNMMSAVRAADEMPSLNNGAGRASSMNLVDSRIRRNRQNRAGVSASIPWSVTSTGWRTSVWLRALPRLRAENRAGPCGREALSQAQHVKGQQFAVNAVSP